MDLNGARVCFPVSSGGHLAQLMRLAPAFATSDRLWVTFDKDDARSALASEVVIPCFYPTNRNLFNLLRNTLLAIKVIRKFRPELIVSTGAAVAVPFFYVGKLFGARVIYVEVFDRIDRPTLTGRLVRPITDAFIVQWPEQLGVYRGSVFLGSIF